MNIEERLQNCDVFLNQIKHFDPDPYYVNYFFIKFIDEINNILNGIFEEGNRDFGLFIKGKISQKKFNEIANSKDDKKAIEFSKWFLDTYIQEHKNAYPNFIRKICEMRNGQEKIPSVKIMIRPKDRYENDVSQQIHVKLSNGKLISKEELKIEINRQLPVFLEVINHKRNEKNEPKVRDNQIIASAFMEISNEDDFEIYYAAEIYIPVLKRLIDESRVKIKELTTWNN